MRCPRCGGYLTQHKHYEEGLDAGTFADLYARCWQCGMWYWQPRLKVIIRAAFIAKGLQYQATEWEKCRVVGCNNLRRTHGGRVNKDGLCLKHVNLKFNLQRGKYKGHSLTRQENGEWIET